MKKQFNVTMKEFASMEWTTDQEGNAVYMTGLKFKIINITNDIITLETFPEINYHNFDIELEIN